MAAKLPDLGNQVRPIPQPAGGIASYQGRTGGETVAGESMMRLGAEMGRDADQIHAAWKIEEEKTDTLRAEEAFSKLREKQLDLTIGPENGYANQKGSAAINRPIAKEWGGRFDQAYKEINGTLANDAQKAKFKQRATISRLQFDEGMLGHLAKQNDVYAAEVYQGTLRTEARAATAQWDNPTEVATSIERIRAAVDEQAKRNGWAPEFKEAEFQKAAGVVHSSVIGQAIASGKLEYAEAWYKQNKADIDPATAKALERAVEDGTQKQLSNGYRADLLASQNNFKALGALKDRILADPKLDDGRRNALVGPIQNQMFALETRARAERERRERQFEGVVRNFNADTLAGFPGHDPQRGLDLIAAAKGNPALEAQARQAFELANQTRAFANMPQIDQERELTLARAAVARDPGRFDRKVLDAWESIYKTQTTRRNEDPTTYALTSGIVRPEVAKIAMQPLDLTAKGPDGQLVGASVDVLLARAGVADGVATLYRVPNKPLTKAEVDLAVAGLRGLSTNDKEFVFQDLARKLRGRTETYKAIMAQIAPDEPLLAMAGIDAERGREVTSGKNVSNLVLRGQAIMNPQPSDGKAGGKLLPMPKDQAMMRREFDNYVVDAYAGEPRINNAYYQKSQAIYMALSSDSRDSDTSILNLPRWHEAMRLATGGIAPHNGKNVQLPWGMNVADFQNDLARRTQDLRDGNRLPDGVTPQKLLELPLEAVGDGKYAFVAGDALVAAKDKVMVKGKLQAVPIVLDFNQSAAFRSSGGTTIKPPTPPRRAITDYTADTRTRRDGEDDDKRRVAALPPEALVKKEKK